ncbi:MAG: hypothetical protein LQ346_008896, partial [Caloplaca aetnensis]
MSHSIDGAITKFKGIKNIASKFSASAVEGSRLAPSKVKDPQFQVRLDAGHYDPSTKILNVVMQVNSQAKSPALVKWVKENSTHGKLATATFKTDAEDKPSEVIRMLEEL